MHVKKFQKLIPILNETQHKGSCGRVGVIGGSLEYTGAPYFAAISALKAGADLVHVFCSQSAGPVIKSYSPELIVHPLLDVPNAVEEISQWLPRLHALVVGPGLGRNQGVLATVTALLDRATSLIPNVPIILDADGLFLMSETPEQFRCSPRPLIITPNKMELSRLPSTHFDGVLYLIKGATDKITKNGTETVSVSEPGSFRRCGGQGDVLSGLVGVFSAWTFLAKSGDYVSAAVAASSLTRRCSFKAFQVHKRSMVASNLIEQLPIAFEELFEGS